MEREYSVEFKPWFIYAKNKQEAEEMVRQELETGYNPLYDIVETEVSKKIPPYSIR